MSIFGGRITSATQQCELRRRTLKDFSTRSFRESLKLSSILGPERAFPSRKFLLPCRSRLLFAGRAYRLGHLESRRADNRQHIPGSSLLVLSDSNRNHFCGEFLF